MTPSFGITKLISEHPSYNFGLALPFVLAFYLLNSTAVYSIPIINLSIGLEFSNIIKVIFISLYYVLFIMFLLSASILSRAIMDSKIHLVWPIFTLTASICSFIFNDGEPLFTILFGITAFLYLSLSKHDDGNLSALLIQLVFGSFSMFCFVTGILWLDGHFMFKPTIEFLFGFDSLKIESLKIGAVMLIVLGYSTFYSIFKVGEFNNGAKN